jgi:preprotein translocase subunit YajC
MIIRNLYVCALGLALGVGCLAQDQSTPPAGQQGPGSDPSAAGQEGRSGRGMGMGPGGMGMGRGVMGTVTEVAADHFLVKNGVNETYTIHFSVNTRIMKQPAPAPGSTPAPASNPDRPMMGGGSPPTPIKATEIKVGDVIAAGGETDDTAKSVGAVFVMLLDPERAKQMREIQANFGKTWLMGKVTEISDAKVTMHSSVDNADHTFFADENTTFRKHREPVTLGDVQVGDNLRAEGALKGGQFFASAVVVMMPPAVGGPVKRPGDEAPK